MGKNKKFSCFKLQWRHKSKTDDPVGSVFKVALKIKCVPYLVRRQAGFLKTIIIIMIKKKMPVHDGGKLSAKPSFLHIRF